MPRIKNLQQSAQKFFIDMKSTEKQKNKLIGGFLMDKNRLKIKMGLMVGYVRCMWGKREGEGTRKKCTKSYTQRKLAEKELQITAIPHVLIPKCCRKTKNKISLFFIFLHKHMRWVVVRVHSYLATVGLSVRRYWYRT